MDDGRQLMDGRFMDDGVWVMDAGRRSISSGIFRRQQNDGLLSMLGMP